MPPNNGPPPLATRDIILGQEAPLIRIAIIHLRAEHLPPKRAQQQRHAEPPDHIVRDATWPQAQESAIVSVYRRCCGGGEYG